MENYVIVFDDGAYLCTCMLLSRGNSLQIAKFHISMISKRWHKEIININNNINDEKLLSSNVVGIYQQSQQYPIQNFLT